MIRAECPHCSFKFDDPDAPLQEGDQLICPECRGIFYVLSIHPPEFHWASSGALGSLFAEALIAKGMSDAGSSDDISHVVERARKQGLAGITFQVCFEEPGSNRITIEVLSVE
jgi:hypothetical protein